MRVRKATIAGTSVDPSTLALLDLTVAHDEVPYEVELSLGDLRAAFFKQYLAWLADMREFPDPDDEIEEHLRGLAWPSLGVLLEVAPEVFAVVMLVLGSEVLEDLEHGRDAMVQVRWVPRSVDEVELRGRRIVLRGTALALPPQRPRPAAAA